MKLKELFLRWLTHMLGNFAQEACAPKTPSTEPNQETGGQQLGSKQPEGGRGGRWASLGGGRNWADWEKAEGSDPSGKLEARQQPWGKVLRTGARQAHRVWGREGNLEPL